NRGGRLRALLRGSVAGVAATLVLSAIAAPEAHAYVVKKTSRGELVHWEGRTVDYTFDPSIAANVPDALTATSQAMVSWSGTVGAPDLQGHEAADVTAPPSAPGYDQKNGVFFMPNGYAPAGKALAITVLTYDNASGRILDADIIVNGSYKFAVLEGVTDAARKAKPVAGAHPSTTDGIAHQDEAQSLDTVYDLHHVVAHELGHSLGMNDELERKDALMYRYSAPNDATMRAPASDDIAGLAELYSTKLEASGNGCGSATVAPRKPSLAASHLAMAATFGLLFFLILRGRSDRRARLAFVVAAALSAYVLLPSISKNESVARAGELAPGHARAKVLTTSTSTEAGLLKTTYRLATTVCRAATCPKMGEGSAWGGTAGDIRQEVGGQFAPRTGDDVDVSFAALPNALAPLSLPLGAAAESTAAVRVITPAN
ncbi:MAG TPA: matrixin family metalloprotease, partial [Labilithrix sp.]|nr:matrixin family metalloprotease [Labilithrix sp.]